MRLMKIVAPLIAVVLLTSACAPEPVITASASATPSETTSPSTAIASPLTTPSTSPASTNGVPTCWTVATPNITITSTQTPEQFTEQNQALVNAGTPAPCSLFATGSHRDVATAWIEGLIAAGWKDGGVVDDDVYGSRSATDGSGLTASYLVTLDGTRSDAVTQFQIYRR